eukprot:scaffold594_cov116-Isochrysis_galbana.AAC.1
MADEAALAVENFPTVAALGFGFFELGLVEGLNAFICYDTILNASPCGNTDRKEKLRDHDVAEHAVAVAAHGWAGGAPWGGGERGGAAGGGDVCGGCHLDGPRDARSAAQPGCHRRSRNRHVPGDKGAHGRLVGAGGGGRPAAGAGCGWDGWGGRARAGRGGWAWSGCTATDIMPMGLSTGTLWLLLEPHRKGEVGVCCRRGSPPVAFRTVLWPPYVRRTRSGWTEGAGGVIMRVETRARRGRHGTGREPP